MIVIHHLFPGAPKSKSDVYCKKATEKYPGTVHIAAEVDYANMHQIIQRITTCYIFKLGVNGINLKVNDGLMVP